MHATWRRIRGRGGGLRVGIGGLRVPVGVHGCPLQRQHRLRHVRLQRHAFSECRGGCLRVWVRRVRQTGASSVLVVRRGLLCVRRGFATGDPNDAFEARKGLRELARPDRSRAPRSLEFLHDALQRGRWGMGAGSKRLCHSLASLPRVS